MGPPPFGDGNRHPSIGAHAPTYRASMGPPPFGDGNAAKVVDCIPQGYASMGPPPFGDGNWSTSRPRSSTTSCFNGATAFRRWKLDLPVDQVLLAVGASMGPPPFGDGNVNGTAYRFSVRAVLQWGHRLSAMETGTDCARITADTWASMGPPPFGDGNAHALLAAHQIATGFNEATAFRRWKQQPCLRVLRFISALQWGHRLSAMETFLRPERDGSG